LLEARLLGVLKMIRDFQPVSLGELEAIAWARGPDYGLDYSDWVCSRRGCRSRRLRADLETLSSLGLVRGGDAVELTGKGLEILAVVIKDHVRGYKRPG
jgi:hypothetical protein